MGELLRDRHARDMHVSRSHLFAMGAGTLVLVGTAFAVGFTLGTDGPVEEPMAPLHDDDLVELLARVESGALRDGGVEALTFPDALEGRLPAVPAIATGAVELVPGAPFAVQAVAPPAGGDRAPEAAWVVDLGVTDFESGQALRDQVRGLGLDARLVVSAVDGAIERRVVIDGFADEVAATEGIVALAAVRQELGHPPLVRANTP